MNTLHPDPRASLSLCPASCPSPRIAVSLQLLPSCGGREERPALQASKWGILYYSCFCSCSRCGLGDSLVELLPRNTAWLAGVQQDPGGAGGEEEGAPVYQFLGREGAVVPASLLPHSSLQGRLSVVFWLRWGGIIS